MAQIDVYFHDGRPHLGMAHAYLYLKSYSSDGDGIPHLTAQCFGPQEIDAACDALIAQINLHREQAKARFARSTRARQ